MKCKFLQMFFNKKIQFIKKIACNVSSYNAKFTFLTPKMKKVHANLVVNGDFITVTLLNHVFTNQNKYL